jgi:CysZ protein
MVKVNMKKGFFSGIHYNLKGLKLGLKTPKLLFLGLIRFFLTGISAVVSAILVWHFYQDIFLMIWSRPDSQWIVWLWHFSSWLVGILMFCMAAMVSYLVGQIAFGIWIMDMMAQATERLVTGTCAQPAHFSFFKQLFHLIKQETPRAIFPIVLTTLAMILGWMTPLGPILTVLLPLVTALFLAWDNTDLIPARQLMPFKERFKFLKKNLLFHIGFGLWFLIPIANVLLLSFAPVGGALYCIDLQKNE